jgi:hypothetical protein
VPWYNRFSAPKPPYNNDQHPYLVWAMYRLLDGRLEPLARSPLKHAFATINAGCPPCEPGHILWAGTGAAGHPSAGCTDVYAKTTNENRNLLGPRSEVTASTGVWQRCGSIFDPDCDDAMDFPPVTGDFDRRMAVPEAALAVPGALYFVDSWYVVRDDVDIFNSMGYRQVDPVLDGNVWSFGLVGGYAQGPVADAWVDPQAPGRDALNQRLDTGEGWVQLAVRVSYLGGGVYRYDYALVNHDFDRQLASLALPLAAGAGVMAASFTDADEDPANDWAASVVGDSLVWQAPDAAAAADWGTLLSFSFQSTTPPAAAAASLGVAEAGDPASLTISTLAPGVAELFADGFEGGTTAAWSATVP